MADTLNEAFIEAVRLGTAEPEPLHPDLVPYKTATSLGPAVLHKLVHEIFYTPALNAIINKSYTAKLALVDDALVSAQWHSYVFLHERPYRVGALLDVLARTRAPEDVWPLVADVWVDSENIFQNLSVWKRIWALPIPKRHELVMDDDERDVLAKLPDTVQIYRGYVHRKSRLGLSWTLDRERAKWFARRYSRDGVVVSGTVPKSNVLAYFDRRGESEIVALPKHIDEVG